MCIAQECNKKCSQKAFLSEKKNAVLEPGKIGLNYTGVLT